MTDWKPGQKLEGENGQRAIWLGWPAVEERGNAAMLHSGKWSEWSVDCTRWTPVDDWPDPVAEARERIRRACQGLRYDDAWLIVDDVLRNYAADLRVLLDAEEAK